MSQQAPPGGGSVATKVRSFFDDNSYLLGGANDLSAYRARLVELVTRRPLTDAETSELRRLIAAQKVILET